jgi:hypothetical protein
MSVRRLSNALEIARTACILAFLEARAGSTSNLKVHHCVNRPPRTHQPHSPQRRQSQETVDMRPFQAFKDSLRNASPTNQASRAQSVGLSARYGPETASRHDEVMLTSRTVSPDPYKAWLEQREADRRREEHRLNPRAAWDDLRSTQSFCAVGRR